MGVSAGGLAGVACGAPATLGDNLAFLGVRVPLGWGHVPPLFENAPPNVPPHTPGFMHTYADACALVKAHFHREKEKSRKLVEAVGL